jgi:hypothetical protein
LSLKASFVASEGPGGGLLLLLPKAATMKENTTKPGYFGTGKQLVPLTFMMLALCAISFYLGCAFSSTPSEQVLVESVQTETSVAETTDCIPIFKHVDFTPCNITLQDMTPCTDPKVEF